MFKKMKKISRVSIVSLMMLILLMSVPFPTLASSNERVIDGTKLVLNGEVAIDDTTLHLKDGKIFVPVGVVVPLMSGSIKWNQADSEAVVASKRNDHIIFADQIPTVAFNDERYILGATPFLDEGRLFVPVRQVAELLHATISWDNDNNILSIESIPLAKVSEDNNVRQISQDYEVDLKALLNRNGYESEEDVEVGSELAFIIPSVLSHKAVTYTEADFNLLAKIVQVESGYEGYEGQLAVANVILNRVKSEKFPSTIKNVIYSGKQFPPAHNGLLDKSVPNKSVLKATRDAMNGKNNVGDAVYFYNPKVSSGSFWSSLDTVASIGNHRFAK